MRYSLETLIPHVTVHIMTVKELYNGLPDLLTQVAHEELEKLPGVTECNITYLPQVTVLVGCALRVY